MKKKFLLVIVLFGFIFISCNKEDQNGKIEPSNTTFTLRCKTEQASEESKTTIAGTDLKSIHWSPNEVIRVFMVDATTQWTAYKFVSTNTVPSADAEFEYSGRPLTGNYEPPLYALYPYNSETDPSLQQTSATNVNIRNVQFKSIQRAKENSFDDSLFISVGKLTNKEDGIIQFKNVCSGLYFTVTHDDVYSVNLEGKSSTNNSYLAAETIQISLNNTDIPEVTQFTNGTNKITIYPPVGETYFKKNTRYYIVTLPGTFDKGITLTANTPNGYYSRGTQNKVVFVRSKMNKALEFDKNLTIKDYTYQDLSTKDIYGNTIGRTTANCYIIKEPGHYQFPVVFGNALKNGANNTTAYRSNIQSQYALGNLIDAVGHAINNPWISKSPTGISTAGHIWQDKPVNMIEPSSIKIEEKSNGEHYIKFEVRGPIVKGNCVIGVLPRTGTFTGYAWCWHIWFYDGDLTPVNNFLPVNLGWDGEVHPYYAWGSHIPVAPYQEPPSTTGIERSLDRKPYYYYGSNYRLMSGEWGVVANGDGFHPITHTIQRPRQINLYYYHNTGYNNRANLWDIDAPGLLSSGTTQVQKTIYDPSPIGFSVPPFRVANQFKAGGNNAPLYDGGYYYGYAAYTLNGSFINNSGLNYASVMNGQLLFPLTSGRVFSSAYIPIAENYNINVSFNEAAYLWTAHYRYYNQTTQADGVLNNQSGDGGIFFKFLKTNNLVVPYHNSPTPDSHMAVRPVVEGSTYQN